MNSLKSKDDDQLFLENEKFSQEFINSKKNKGKLIIGEGSFGKVRLAISVFGNEKFGFGEIACVKKTYYFGYRKNENTAPLNIEDVKNNLDALFIEYTQKELPEQIYSPRIIDFALVLNESKKERKKGYLIMEAFPHDNAKTIFESENSNFSKWEFQKPYIIGLLDHINTLLKKNLFFPDLKPANTLFNISSKKIYIIDTGSIIEFSSYEAQNYSFDRTPEYTKSTAQAIILINILLKM